MKGMVLDAGGINPGLQKTTPLLLLIAAESFQGPNGSLMETVWLILTTSKTASSLASNSVQ